MSLKNNYPLQIFRLAGIYSNEFNILKRLQTGKVQLVDKKNHFFSRIHVEDIANILFSLLIILKIMKFIIFVMINPHHKLKLQPMGQNY